MSDDLHYKPLSTAAIPGALRKAEQYRALNDPTQAESVCHDILAADPDNQDAIVLMVLSLTDQFGGEHAPSTQKTREFISKLDSEYRRRYYTGLLHERRARAMLARGVIYVYEGFREAMDWYDQAAAIRPSSNDEAILRWNSCLRTIEQKGLTPAPAEREHPLE